MNCSIYEFYGNYARVNDRFVIVSGFQPLIVLPKRSILDVWLGSNYGSEHKYQKPSQQYPTQKHLKEKRQNPDTTLQYSIFGNCRPELFCKKVFLKMSQNSQENVCAWGSF